MSENLPHDRPGPPKKPIFRIKASTGPKRKKRCRRSIVTRISSSSSSSDEDFSIKRSVARNHLTANNARTIIKSVVSNEFVIAAVQQRADELERQLKERKEKISETLLRELPDGQKMTRNRAREFNHSTLPICDLNAVEPDQLIKNLISSNLHEEDDPVGDDDDEYKPHFEEEDDSDEYSSATCSDIESQPQTPLTSSKYDTEVRMVRYDHKEGIFKLPQSPSVVKTPNRTTEETISRRTRSQVSLVSKTIEGIQQPLIPMDLPQEYGETEFEPDHNWEDFLDQFQKPLEAIDGEEGEETDPEYVCNETANTETLADSIVVTKREADSLLQEIYDELERDLESSFPTETFRATSSPNKNYYPSESMVESLPISEVDQGVENITESTIEVQKSEPIAIIPYEAQVDSQLLPATSTQTNFNIIQGTDDKMYLLPSISSQSEAKLKTAFLEINVSEDLPTIMAKIRHQKELHYQNVHKESLQLNGWTAKSLRIFHRQLMVHVQLLGQMFVQTYSHPKLWADAKHHKRLLKDLWKRRESNSVLNCLCWNLPDMMVICRDWERELSVESEENQDYVRALMSGGHHDRVLERIVNSRAFMFEEYLPATAAITFHVNTRCVPARVLLFIVFLRNRNVRTSKGSIMYKSFVAFKKRYGEKRAACHYYQLLTYETVKKYLRTGEVPQLPFKEIEYERYETYENVVPIVARTIGKWPKPWKDIVKKQRLMVKEKRNANEKEKEVPVTVTMNFPMFKAEIAVPNRPVYYGIGDEVPESEDDPSITDDEGVCVEDSLERVNEEKRKVPVKKRKHGGKPNLGGNLVGMIKKALRKKKKCQKGRRRIGQYLTKILERKRVTKKFSTLLRDTDYKYDLNMGSLEPNLISTKIFNYLKEFDLFARVLFARSCQNRNSRLKHAPLRKLDVKTEIYNPQPSLPSQPSTTEATIEKDPFFAWKYVGVVERTVGEGFEQFVQVLKRLKLGSSSVVDFYLEIEELFLEDFPELLNMFLVALLPGHVSQIGKFLQEMIYGDLVAFKSQLTVYMTRQRRQMDQIFDLLNELAMRPDTGRMAIKERFLTIIDGNPLMTKWFLQLFPAEQASLNDSETIQFWCLENRIILPGTLHALLGKSRATSEGQKSPQLNLMLSDSDAESDSVEFMGEESVGVDKSVSMHSICSDDSEGLDNQFDETAAKESVEDAKSVSMHSIRSNLNDSEGSESDELFTDELFTEGEFVSNQQSPFQCSFGNDTTSDSTDYME